MEVMHVNCAGLDIHKNTVVAAIRIHNNGKPTREVRTFSTMTKDLLSLQDWLNTHFITNVAMQATGVYWKPVWHILESSFELLLANPAHIEKSRFGRRIVQSEPLLLENFRRNKA